MGLKRKRNLKVDAITKYSVFILGDLDSEYLEDYIEARDTGMEADEEKEIQLQKIIQGNGGNIPLPVITKIENPARRLYGPTVLKRHIRWSRDVPNECIEAYCEVAQIDALFQGNGRSGGSEAAPRHDGALELAVLKTGDTASTASHGNELSQNMPTTAELFLDGVLTPNVGQDEHAPKEQHVALRKAVSAMSTPVSEGPSQNKITVHENEMDGLVAVSSVSKSMRDAFAVFGGSTSATANKDEKLINYVLHRVILRYERAGYEAYTCFRRRVFHPTFKSRRNEAIMLEKLERMGAEFHALEDLCSMLLEKTRMEHRYLRQTGRLVEAYHSPDISRRRRRSYRKQILGVAEARAPSRMSLNVHAMMTNRDKIAYLRNIKPPTDLIMDVNYYTEIGPLLRSARALEAGEDAKPPAGSSPTRKKVCRRCESRWSNVFYTDDRKHNV